MKISVVILSMFFFVLSTTCMAADSLNLFNSSPSIHKAIQKDDIETVKRLLAKKQDLRQQNAYGDTPLSVAAKTGNLEIAKLLVANKADIHATNNASETPIFVASFYGHFDMVKWLIDEGSNINNTNVSGLSPLQIALKNSKIDQYAIARLLIDKGTNPCNKDYKKDMADWYIKEYLKEYLPANLQKMTCQDFENWKSLGAEVSKRCQVTKEKESPTKTIDDSKRLHGKDIETATEKETNTSAVKEQ